tara:strand:- start:267 stop:614 length:348 start_codon:yes stop_codon:yes gene_type:complete
MSTGYIKRKSDGRILCSNSSQDESNPAHLQALQNFVTSRGMSLADHEIGFTDKATVKGWIDSAVTPLEAWEKQMRETDSMPRWFEDYVTENSVTLAAGKAKDSYDAKVQRRSEKP